MPGNTHLLSDVVHSTETRVRPKFSNYSSVARALLARLNFFLAFFAPGGQKWQWPQAFPYWQPTGLWNHAQGLHVLPQCEADPMDGGSLITRRRHSSAHAFLAVIASQAKTAHGAKARRSSALFARLVSLRSSSALIMQPLYVSHALKMTR